MSNTLYRLNVWYDRLDPVRRFYGFFLLIGTIFVADIGLTLLKMFPVGGLLSGICMVGLVIPRIWYIDWPHPHHAKSYIHVATKPPKPAFEAALKILGLSEMPNSMAILASAYRKAARSAHPDAGGSDAKFIAVRRAYLRIREGMKTIQ